MPDERTSIATTAAAGLTSPLRITKLLSGSTLQICEAGHDPRISNQIAGEFAEQPLLTCVIFAVLDGQLFAGREYDLFETQDLRAVSREITRHRDLISRLKRTF